MTTTDPRPDTRTWTREDVWALGDADALRLFGSLPTVAFDELDGEYEGFMLRQETEEAALSRAKFMERWKGKSYRPTGQGVGEGYNWWQEDGQTTRHMRFGTEVAPSYYDGRPVFRMRYAAFDNGPAKSDLTDEIRKVADGLYLCIATRRAEGGGRTKPGIFGLAGPVRAWVGPDDPHAETPVR